MRCPKCQYISFDRGDRCRNCGYEFSLSPPADDVDLPLKTGDEPLGPMSDFSLAEVEGLHERQRGTQSPPEPPRASGRGDRAAPLTGDLPLFRDRPVADDAPLVSLPAAPRPPVAVRRAAPAARTASSRPAADEPELDLGPPPAAPRPAPSPQSPSRTEPADAAQGAAPASAGLRLLAAGIDIVLLGVIDAAVLSLTLEVSGLEWAEVAIIPVVPFLAFVALLNGGYMITFTAAGGQSIGKMLAGIRVVTADPDAWTDRVSLGQAVLRAVGYVAAALPLGLGFLPAFIGADRRGIHDRLADTRVVRT